MIARPHRGLLHPDERRRRGHAHHDAAELTSHAVEVLESPGGSQARQEVDDDRALRRPISHCGICASQVFSRDLIDVRILPQRSQGSAHVLDVDGCGPDEEIDVFRRPKDSVNIDRNPADEDVLDALLLESANDGQKLIEAHSQLGPTGVMPGL